MTPEERRRDLVRRIHAAKQNLHVTPDRQAKEESEDLDAQRRKAELTGLKQDIDERKRYALLFFCRACGWMVIIVALLFLQGSRYSIEGMRFKLSDPVMLAVIGSTTVNILGILYVVANYLFPKRDS